MTHPPPEAIGMNGFPCFPLSDFFCATSSPTFPQFSRHQVNSYVTLPGHLHHWQLREGSTGVAVLYHWRLGPMVGCGRLPNVMDRGFFEWFLRHATSSQQRVWSYEPSQTRKRQSLWLRSSPTWPVALIPQRRNMQRFDLRMVVIDSVDMKSAMLTHSAAC